MIIYLSSTDLLWQTGRIGREAPAEHIIASLVAVCGAYIFPLVAPFAQRFGGNTVLQIVVLLNLTTAISIAVFSSRSPFDKLHQRRLFVLDSVNVRSSQ